MTSKVSFIVRLEESASYMLEDMKVRLKHLPSHHLPEPFSSPRTSATCVQSEAKLVSSSPGAARARVAKNASPQTAAIETSILGKSSAVLTTLIPTVRELIA